MPATPKLKLVGEHIDITRLNNADILNRDWDAAMVWADRQKPVSIADQRRVRRG